jgi:hypothetical protein
MFPLAAMSERAFNLRFSPALGVVGDVAGEGDVTCDWIGKALAPVADGKAFGPVASELKVWDSSGNWKSPGIEY